MKLNTMKACTGCGGVVICHFSCRVKSIAREVSHDVEGSAAERHTSIQLKRGKCSLCGKDFSVRCRQKLRATCSKACRYAQAKINGSAIWKFDGLAQLQPVQPPTPVQETPGSI